MIEIRHISFKELYQDPKFGSLVKEYTKESELEELAPINIDVALYERMNQAGVLYVMAAFKDDEMLGFSIITISPNLHYSKKIAGTESFFVGENHRKLGVGVYLLKEMEKKAKELGAACLFVSTPTGSKLCEVMEKHKSYRETHRIFLKSLA